jgi:hypothetical protein
VCVVVCVVVFYRKKTCFYPENPSPDRSGILFDFSLKLKKFSVQQDTAPKINQYFIKNFKKKPLLIKVTALY